MEHVVPVEIRH